MLEPTADAIAAAAHMEATLAELVQKHRQFKGANRTLRYVHRKYKPNAPPAPRGPPPPPRGGARGDGSKYLGMGSRRLARGSVGGYTDPIADDTHGIDPPYGIEPPYGIDPPRLACSEQLTFRFELCTADGDDLMHQCEADEGVAARRGECALR